MVMVGVEKKGCFHFDLMSGRNNILMPGYVGEKLNLSGSDAKGIARLLDFIRKAFAEGIA
jgi:hypothetical protein